MHKKSRMEDELQVLDSLLMEDAAQDYAAEFMHGMNQFVQSAIELTKVIVETERLQSKVLDRKAILEIYSQAMTSIGQSIGNMSKEL